MRKKLKVIFCLSLIFVFLGGLAFAQDNPALTQKSSIHVKKGESFVIVLESNRTTGYQWQLAKSLDSSVIIVEGLRYIRPQGKALGAPGKEEWTFKALKSGNIKVFFHYVRPWDKEKPPAKAKTFDIVIK
jgi:inhibitor of cysteine peptidase